MNAAQLYNLLRQPGSLKNTDKQALEQLVREYPYFQTAYLLLAKKSHLDHEANFETKLNLAASYAIDRIKLFELINQKAGSLIPAESQKKKIEEDRRKEILQTSDQELNELLQSVHDRKQQVLSHSDYEKPEDESVMEEMDALTSYELGEPVSEFLPPAEELTDIENSDDEIIFPSELDVIKGLENELRDQDEYELGEEFLLVNELGGGGSEYFPMEELPDEESENSFVEEADPEVESISVIEEEFVMRDLDIEMKEKEIGLLSETETPLQVETDNKASIAFEQDAELESVKEIEFELEDQHEYEIDAEELIQNETPIDHPELITPEENFFGTNIEIEAVGEMQNSGGETSLRFSEHVESPGVFLPEKSHTFLEWLQFFKSEPSKKKNDKQADKAASPGKEKEPDITPETGEGAPRRGMEVELETIDKIVSTLKHEVIQHTNQFLSPEQLAQKSIQMDEEIISETLAKILEEQGKYDKAIRMYARLSLKFPEKIAFFAARIKELKSKK